MTEQPTATTGTLPLFYKNPMPLEPARHGNAGLNPKSDFAFARDTNAIALTLSSSRWPPVTIPSSSPRWPRGAVRRDRRA